MYLNQIPKVGLLIPHYNNVNGLIKSLTSLKEDICFYTFIIDDGSQKDPLPDDDFFKAKFPDLNIYVYRLEKNCGIETALNLGLKKMLEHNIDLVARLDCGDFNEKNRLALQRDFLFANPDIYLVGSHCEYFDSVSGKTVAIKKHSSDQLKIKQGMYFNTVFEHPCVMFRLIAVQHIGYYPLNYKAAEDYAYFFKFIKKYRCSNIEQVLVRKEVSDTSISTLKRKTQVFNRIKIIIENFEFKWYCLFGLIYNSILYILPYSFTNKLKKYFFT